MKLILKDFKVPLHGLCDISWMLYIGVNTISNSSVRSKPYLTNNVQGEIQYESFYVSSLSIIGQLKECKQQWINQPEMWSLLTPSDKNKNKNLWQ